MTAPKPPHVSIVILTLIPVIALAWSSFTAPCIEIGFFWASVVTALSASLYAWCNSDRMGQGGMLLIYCMIACAITLAVASVVDLANFSLLGERHDAQTGILLGGLIAFSTVACIAVRSSLRFPSSLTWGASLAFCMAFVYGSIYITKLEPEYVAMIQVISLLVGMAAFIILCRCKANLSDGQYLAVLAIVVLFIEFHSPLPKENLIAGIIASLSTFLAGVLFFTERKAAAKTTRVAGILLLYFGITDTIGSTLHSGLGINEVVAGIPSVLFTLIVLTWIWFRRTEIPRGLYWVALFTFSYLGIIAVIPEAYCDPLTSTVFATMALYIAACLWYISISTVPLKQTWTVPLRHALAAGYFVVALSVTAAWFTVSLDMLADNYGPVRLLVRLKNTPLWPGDAAFVRLVMRDESLWADDVGDVLPGKLSLDDYLEAIRPGSDQFSGIVDSKDHRGETLGFDGEGFGIQWVMDKDRLMLTKVNSRSSAGKIGLGRGDRVLTINGTRVKEIGHAAWKKLSSECKSGAVVSMNVVTHSGKNRTIAMKVGINPQDPPKSLIVATPNGNKVGYLYLESFNEAQFKRMNSHFEVFKKVGVRDLVLDLRYNTGGLMREASLLAGFIAGEELDGKLFIRMEPAPKYVDKPFEYYFESLPESIQARRLIVLTTDDTCSASEAVISGLRPYMPVYTVGSTTCGKPYGMDGVEFGDKILLPVTSRVVNSRGEGNYTNGIKADIKAKDDLTRQLGDPHEGMLKKALEVLEKDAFKR